MLRVVIIVLASLWLNIINAAVIEGNENGEITLAFIYDYQCEHCHSMYPLIQDLKNEYPDLKIRMMPVAVLNQVSLYEASAAIASTHTNQFQALTNAIMNRPALSQDEFTALLKKMGMDTPAFQNAMHSQAVKAQIMQGQSLMDASGQHSVPLIIIYPSALDPSHSLVLSGEQSQLTLEKAINTVQQKIQKATAQPGV